MHGKAIACLVPLCFTHRIRSASPTWFYFYKSRWLRLPRLGPYILYPDFSDEYNPILRDLNHLSRPTVNAFGPTSQVKNTRVILHRTILCTTILTCAYLLNGPEQRVALVVLIRQASSSTITWSTVCYEKVGLLWCNVISSRHKYATPGNLKKDMAPG